MCVLARMLVCGTHSHFLMMTEKSMFALHTPDSPVLPPQWNDCGKTKKEMSKVKDELLKELVS